MRDRILAGHLPLWNPYNYAGQPFAANPQVTLFYPPSWVHLVLPVPVAARALVVVHTALAGMFMYLFLRRLELGGWAGLAGALPWMLGSYLTAKAAVGHLPMVFTATWLPLVLLSYERALRSERRRAYTATGAIMGLQVLAGEPQNSYYTALGVALWGLVRHWRNGGARAVARRYLPSMLVVAVTALAVSAVQVVPTVEMMRHSDRSQPSYGFSTQGSFSPADALSFLVPWSSSGRMFLRGDPPQPFSNAGWEHAGYLGVLTLVLAMAALGRRRAGPVVAALALLATGLVLMLGGYTPLYRVLYAVLPGLSLFRLPSRALVLLTFALCVLAGYGLQALIERREPRGWRWAALGAVAVAAAGWAGLVTTDFQMLMGNTFDAAPGVIRGRLVRLTLDHPTAFLPLVCVALSAALLVVLPPLGGRARGASVVAVVAADLMLARPSLPLADPGRARQDVLALQALPQAAGPLTRVDLAPGHVDALVALGARVENVNGYWPLALARFYRYVHAVRGEPVPGQSRHQVHDASYRAGTAFAPRLLGAAFASVPSGAGDGFSLVRSRAPLPRAWMVDRAEVIADEEAQLAHVLQADFDPARTVVLEARPTLSLLGSGEPAGRALARRVDDQALEIDTESDRPAYLVLSEIHYPGWRATMDGAPAPLERADYLLTAVALPAGRHRVRYSYEPRSVQVGAAITGLALLALGASAVGRARGPRD